ncbi:putative phosphoenolpyruvate phosphomutase [Aspergillus bombycis]|uniref:Putative phosphoenolpyruvate phosphomutase n=1 Tax=Aspergillus bombycis TaxID=109264 RepID=A0A1F8A984_9EURO|nr:putative phosphoenolpyruvate phosphomutase [Aspergillus bombycis]OGM48251.1 putative phosphoenolpyruvate phosphomutase [Aspergillus bombycis]
MSPSIKSVLKKNQGRVRLLEAHDHATKETIRGTFSQDGESFDGIWLSGLTQTTYLGIPDTELISPLQRVMHMSGSNNNTEQEGRRPLCAAFDADSGGNVEEIPQLMSCLRSLGISMVIIEDKSLTSPGQKINSLAGASHSQGQANMYEFVRTLQAFKAATGDSEIMITARIESFTTRTPEENEAKELASVQLALEDALVRAELYKSCGADAIMIHSKSKSPLEVLAFLNQFRSQDADTPLVVVPTTYGSITDQELYEAGANIIIYANHLMRAKITAVDAMSTFLLATRQSGFSFGNKSWDCALQFRNFGYLLQKLEKAEGLSESAHEYRALATRYALIHVKKVIRVLLEGQNARAADNHIITAKELLDINSQQISPLNSLLLEEGKESYTAKL